MGAYLSSPITVKDSEGGQNKKIAYGASSMQGWRDTQEDAHNCILDFDDETALFGVYDGHGGAEVAIYTSEKLPSFIKDNEQYKSGDCEEALISAFLAFDDTLTSKEALTRMNEIVRSKKKRAPPSDDESESSVNGEPARSSSKAISKEQSEENSKLGVASGCTAVVALIKDNTLYVANAGDCRCVICKDGKAVDMSEDHTPELDSECKRIRKAGGRVNSGRVEGDLNLTRAMGDHQYKRNTELSNKEQIITALPDIRTCKLEPDVEFIVLACDGIWKSMSSQKVVDFVKPKIQSNQKLSTICEELCDVCLSPTCHICTDIGSDNMTCIIVKIRKDGDTEQPESAESSQNGKDDEDNELFLAKKEEKNESTTPLKISTDSTEENECQNKRQKTDTDVDSS